MVYRPITASTLQGCAISEVFGLARVASIFSVLSVMSSLFGPRHNDLGQGLLRVLPCHVTFQHRMR